MAWVIFDETKGLSSFCSFSWFLVTSPVRNREVNELEALIEIEDLQVEPLSKMKKHMVGKLSSGGEF